MRVVYVSGAYRGKSKWRVIRFLQQCRNIWIARKTAIRLWERGYAVICPHMNTAFFELDSKCKDEEWLAGDFAMIYRGVDDICMVNWKTSDGAQQELAIAQDVGCGVMYE